jgi:RimJ/RimL family protein N-acetyltransferase
MIDLLNISHDNSDQLEKIMNWKSNEILCDNIMAEPVSLTFQETKDWVQKNSTDKNQELKGIFYREKANDPVIFLGVIRLMFIDDNANTAEVGLYIGDSSLRGKKIGKNALKQLIEVYAKERNINKLHARIRVSNNVSLKLFRSLNFTQEGFLKNHYYSKLDKTFDDVILMARFMS